MKQPIRQRIFLGAILLLAGLGVTLAQNPPAATNDGPATQGVGLIRNDPGAFQGYTLLSPLSSTATYLIDMNGRVVKTWETGSTPSSIAHLLENGNLLRAGAQANSPYGGGVAGGGGKLQEFDWNGQLVWDFTFSSATQLPHHDFTRLPNGNILMVVQEKKTAAEAIAAGRIPSSAEGTDVRPDSLIEIKPNGKTGGDIVWEWHVWDHLIQDHDKAKANFGDVAAHPERIDVNYTVVEGRRANADWTHFNAVAYNADLDQIVVSLRNWGEIWIIDHSTTTALASGKNGGRGGKGGDLLYRWGNPRVYRAGTQADQQLFGQHNAHWIPKGLPGAGHLLIFNNGDTRPTRFSTVDELVLPADSNGRYTLGPGNKYGPEKPAWSYSAPNPTDFYSVNISGAMRLPNGNTLICSGAPGIVFEVTPQNKVVWQFNLPSFAAAGRGGAAAGGGAAGRGGPAGGGGAAGRGGAAGGGGAAGRGGAAGGGGAAGRGGAVAGGGGAAGRGGAAGGGGAAGRGGAIAGGGGAAGRGGAAGGGGTAGRNVFRAYRYAADFPGLVGKQLVPGKTLEEHIRP